MLLLQLPTTAHKCTAHPRGVHRFDGAYCRWCGREVMEIHRVKVFCNYWKLKATPPAPKRDVVLTESIPFSPAVLRLKRNNYIRYLIFLCLKEGTFEQEALRALVNIVLVERELENLQISYSGFDVMLGRNCERLWTINDRIVSAATDGNAYMRDDRESALELILDKLVRNGEILRARGGRNYQKKV